MIRLPQHPESNSSGRCLIIAGWLIFLIYVTLRSCS